MRLSDATLESVWNKLTYKTLRAPRDVVRAFAALGGAEAEAVYCTMYPDQNRTIWSVLAVNGELLIYVSAMGQRGWHQNDDAQRDSLEAFTYPHDQYDASQHQRAEFVADTIRLRLMGRNVEYGSSL